MKPWSKASPEVYRALPLRAHAVLADMPLHDVWRVSLAGTSRDISMLEARSVALSLAERGPPSLPVQALVGIRRFLGSAFGWDDPPGDARETRAVNQAASSVAASSLVRPGTKDGPFTVLYVLPREAMSTIRNNTVEAWLVWAITDQPGGPEIIWAIHVRPVSIWTRPYLALIAPFRRFLVYPALLRAFRREWTRQPRSAV